jgi:hypothetical protein
LLRRTKAVRHRTSANGARTCFMYGVRIEPSCKYGHGGGRDTRKLLYGPEAQSARSVIIELEAAARRSARRGDARRLR